MSDRVSRFRETLARRPLVLDAALGTRLMGQGLDLSRDDPCLWCLDHPEAVVALHRQDRRSGSDVLLTNTFGASRSNLGRVGRSHDREAVLRAAVSLAREAAGAEGFVAGCLGPVPDEETREYQEQADVLVDRGVDLLILETQQAEAAPVILEAIELPGEMPVIVSLFRLPDRPFALLHRLAERGVAALGVNCVPGPTASIEALERFPEGLPLLAKPSAGASRSSGIVRGSGASLALARGAVDGWLLRFDPRSRRRDPNGS